LGVILSIFSGGGARNLNFFLARLAHLPTGLYLLFLMISRRTIISGSTGPIFTIFTPNESILSADDRSGPLFPISQGTLPWQPIKVETLAFFGPISFLALPFQNGLQYRNFDFKILNRKNFSTLYTILTHELHIVCHQTMFLNTAVTFILQKIE